MISQNSQRNRIQYEEVGTLKEVFPSVEECLEMEPGVLAAQFIPFIAVHTQCAIKKVEFFEQCLGDYLPEERAKLKPALWQAWKWAEDKGLIDTDPAQTHQSEWKKLTAIGRCLRQVPDALYFVENGFVDNKFLLKSLGSASIDRLVRLVCDHSSEIAYRSPKEIEQIFARDYLPYENCSAWDGDLEAVDAWFRKQLNNLNQDPLLMSRFIFSLMDPAEYTPERHKKPESVKTKTYKQIKEILATEGYEFQPSPEGYRIDNMKLRQRRDREAAEKAASAANMAQTINYFNNVGIVNQGTIRDVGAMTAQVTQTLKSLQNAQPELADTLEKVKSSLIECEVISDDIKAEVLDRIEVLADEADKAQEKRSPLHRIKDTAKGITEALKGAGAVSALWETGYKLIQQVFGF